MFRGFSRRTSQLVVAATVAVVLGAWCTRTAEPEPASRLEASSHLPRQAVPAVSGPRGVLTGRLLYVDPGTDAAAQVRQWVAQGRSAYARVLAKIADRPVATWVTGVILVRSNG